MALWNRPCARAFRARCQCWNIRRDTPIRAPWKAVTAVTIQAPSRACPRRAQVSPACQPSRGPAGLSLGPALGPTLGRPAAGPPPPPRGQERVEAPLAMYACFCVRPSANAAKSRSTVSGSYFVGLPPLLVIAISAEWPSLCSFTSFKKVQAWQERQSQ